MASDLATGGNHAGGSLTTTVEILDKEKRRKGLWIFVIGSGSLSVNLSAKDAVANKGIQVTAGTPFALTVPYYKGPVTAASTDGSSVQYSTFEAIE